MAKKQLKKRPKKSTPVSSETLFNKTVVTIGVKSIDRHPENRQPKDTAIDEVVESIDQHGQLEPCLVRQVGRRYQMISGETRWLAVQRLGNKMIDCRVGYDIDDATALTLVAVANGARNDLDPIERAMLLQKLTAPTDEGGSGMTQEDAGKCISMSRSAVANSIRLLTLPDEIKTLIIKGELPESYAREALPLLTNDTSKPIAIKVIKDSIKHPDGLPGRSEFVEELEYKMRSKTRSLKFNSKPQAWQLSANSCAVYYATALFKPTSEQETKLGVVMVGKDKCCTNIKLWEKLQKEAAAKKSTASKSKSSKPTKQLTPAQQRDAEEKKAQQLKRRIDTWAELWKRWWCSHELDIDVGSRIIAVFESESFGGLDEAIGVVVSEEGLPALRGGSDYQNLKKISELRGTACQSDPLADESR